MSSIYFTSSASYNFRLFQQGDAPASTSEYPGAVDTGRPRFSPLQLVLGLSCQYTIFSRKDQRPLALS